MRFVDRSRMEKDWRCPRARYWNYELGGRGVAPARLSFDLEFGTIVHEGVESAVMMRQIGANTDVVIPKVFERVQTFIKQQGGEDVDAAQWGAIGQGLVEGFMRTVWPNLDRDYELVSLEKECDLQLGDNLLFQARPDLIVRHRENKGLWYIELKTTGWIEAQWVQSWNKAPQLQLGALAAEQAFGESLAGCIVVGLYKGRKGREGRQDSPFAWGWKNEGLPGIMSAQFSYEYQRARGWERFPTTEYAGGVSAWVQNMPDDVLGKNFVQTDPIFLRRDVTERLLGQLRAREAEIAEFAEAGIVTPETLDRVFPQFFFNCTPAFGHACEFVDACWVPWIGKDPLKSGQFAWREPHHEAERKYFELKEVA